MKVIVGIIIFLAGFLFLFFVSELYMILRKRLNTPKFGVEILLKLLKRNDYVCIDGRVNQFSHFANANAPLDIVAFPSESNKTIGGELAFVNNHGLGYVYFHPLAMVNCDFIFGKYGLKWARNKAIANIANEKIKKYHYGEDIEVDKLRFLLNADEAIDEKEPDFYADLKEAAWNVLHENPGYGFDEWVQTLMEEYPSEVVDAIGSHPAETYASLADMWDTGDYEDEATGECHAFKDWAEYFATDRSVELYDLLAEEKRKISALEPRQDKRR